MLAARTSIKKVSMKKTATPAKSVSTSRMLKKAPALSLTLYAHSIPTPLGPFVALTDAAGAVRLSRWQTPVDAPAHTNMKVELPASCDAAAAFQAELQAMAAYLQQRFYKTYAISIHQAPGQGGPGAKAAALLDAYFNTPLTPAEQEATLRAIPVAYPPSTPSFTRRAWETLRDVVPAGEVTTYKGLSDLIQAQQDKERKGSTASGTEAARNPAPRAVGGAMNANPICVVMPCHRVVAANSALRGYGLGLRYKVWLLRHEQAGVLESKLAVCEKENEICTKASCQ